MGLTVSVVDNFNRADEGPPPTGWTAWLSTGLKVVSNQCAPNDSGDNGGYWTTAMGSANVEAYVTIATHPAAGGDTGVLARANPTGAGFNGSYYGVHHVPAAGADTVFIEYFNSAGGGGTIGGPWNQELSAGDKLGIRCSGTTIEAWVFTGGSWTMVGSVVDSNIAGTGSNTKVGLYNYGNGGTGARYDDFAAGTIGNSYNQTVSATVTTSASLVKSVGKRISATVTTLASMVRSFTAHPLDVLAEGALTFSTLTPGILSMSVLSPGAMTISALSAGSLGGDGIPEDELDTEQPSIAINRICTNCYQTGQPFSRYQYLFLNEPNADLIPAIKAANPGTKVLAYKCMSSIRANTQSGVTVAESDEAWFAHKTGVRQEWTGFSGHWQACPDNAGYQTRWISNVLTVMARDGWDGVIVDNANMTIPSPGAPYDEYAADSDYQAACRAFLAAVGPSITGAGYIFIPNIQHHGSLLNEALWTDWLQFCTGGHLEHYTMWGSDGTDHIAGTGWETSGQDFLQACNAVDKPFIGTFSCPLSDTGSQVYARASFLMDFDGWPSRSALIFEPEVLNSDPWSQTDWRTDLGAPLSTREADSGGWKRAYEGGMVYVNQTAGTISMDGHSLPTKTGLIVAN